MVNNMTNMRNNKINQKKIAMSRTLTSGMINAMSRTLTTGPTGGLTNGWPADERRTIKNSLRIKSEDKENEMMRLLGQHSPGDTCSESCCEIRPGNGQLFKLPKIRLNREMMQASLNNQKVATGATLRRSMFSKSLDSLANLHLYESLDPIVGNGLQHRISRKRTLNVIFPQINLKNCSDDLKESNEDLLNNDLDDLIDDLNEDVDLNDFGFDSNDECLNDLNGHFNEDEIEFSLGNGFSLPDNGQTGITANLDKQQTTKIVLKKQAKVRQLRPAKLMKDSIVKGQFGGDAFLVKKNSFLSNYYGSESSDESPR